MEEMKLIKIMTIPKELIKKKTEYYIRKPKQYRIDITPHPDWEGFFRVYIYRRR